MFTESKADETFHVTYTYYSMAGRRDIDRTYKCVSEWRFFLVKSCICSFILSCFWPYECVTGLSKVFWVVVSHYVCYSVCFSIFEKNSKVKFLDIFLGWFLLLWDRPQSFEGCCGSFRVLVTTGISTAKRIFLAFALAEKQISPWMIAISFLKLEEYLLNSSDILLAKYVMM